MPEAGPVEWGVFIALVASLLVIDLAYASRGKQRRSARAAWMWSALWIGVALAFGGWISVRLGTEAGLLYITAYFLEESLSIDNLVMFALVFSQTGIPTSLQHRALFWGVIGALVMRALLIGFGILLFQRFHWLVYPFGALLLYAAWRMLRGEQQRRLWVETTCSLCTSWVSRFIPIVPELHGERFTVRVDGKRHATPLLVALVAIESADLLFAVDSIPAVFAVTRDPFLVYTSNVFAATWAALLVCGDRRPRHALCLPAPGAGCPAPSRCTEAAPVRLRSHFSRHLARHHRGNLRRCRCSLATSAEPVTTKRSPHGGLFPPR